MALHAVDGCLDRLNLIQQLVCLLMKELPCVSQLETLGAPDEKLCPEISL